MNIKKIIFTLFHFQLNKVTKYKNLHEGEDCVIFGDGASIKWFDLQSFSKFQSITVGYIPFHNDFIFLNCKYCFLVEPYWFYPMVKTTNPPIKYIFNKIQLKYRKIIKKYPDKEFFINLSNYPVLRGKNINHIFFDLPNSEFINELFQNNINPFHGSFRASITLAIYMGFKTTYLAGFDYTHTPSRNLHWYEKGKGILQDHENYEKEFLEIAKKYINIITITIDGISNKVNYITYANFCNQKCEYKENIEILQKEFLNALKSWKNYKI
jgi:hypothetical protein